jgi:type VI secretion system protein ImpG
LSANETESLLRYYTAELSYLRKMAHSFSRRYPKVASRLELSADQCADPHVERLIESFALLTARLNRRLDGEFPEITSALLGALYPHLVNPVPPMAIAHFEADPEQGKLSSGHLIASGAPLFAQTSEGLTCRFRTCYPVTLWPIEVIDAGFESPAQYDFLDSDAKVACVLRLRLKAAGAAFEELELSRLRFHLTGESTLVNTLYELLFCHVLRTTVLPEGARRPNDLAPACILPVGFEPADEVIPYPPHALPSYRLLQEYFLFPEKFHFFDLAGLEGKCSGGMVDLLILLDRWPPGRVGVTARNFLLGCTPIINLFSGTTEPVRIDQRAYEYQLVPDMRRERTTEIHSIQAVSSSSNPAEHVEWLEPFYSFRHQQHGHESRAFWHARRVPAVRGDLSGTDLILSFFDRDFNPRVPPEQVVYAHVWNTNRNFARQLPAGARLQIENVAPLAGITCLEKPTAPVYPPLEGATLWSLVSNLTLSHLSLSDSAEGLNALRQILQVYSFSDQPSVHQQMQGIRGMSCRHVMRQVGAEPWRGFCGGTEIALTFDPGLYVGTGAFLLGAVLNRFLPLHAAVNSFTELVIRRVDREGEWKRWPPMAGLQELI